MTLPAPDFTIRPYAVTVRWPEGEWWRGVGPERRYDKPSDVIVYVQAYDARDAVTQVRMWCKDGQDRYDGQRYHRPQPVHIRPARRDEPVMGTHTIPKGTE